MMSLGDPVIYSGLFRSGIEELAAREHLTDDKDARQKVFEEAIDAWSTFFDRRGRLVGSDAVTAAGVLEETLAERFDVSPAEVSDLCDLAFSIHSGSTVSQREEVINEVYSQYGWSKGE